MNSNDPFHAHLAPVAPARTSAFARLPRGVRFLLLVSLLGWVTLWAWSLGADRRALLRLPREERAALLTRALEDLRTVCTGPRSSDASLHDFCQERARLVLKLPECDAGCEALANVHLGMR
ncbi:MAG: hypothetical protein L0Y66_19795 [Myxococcaceae bacterium]|nr:hypothetical protein [Myxococcaceae bacterium]MCI0670665.1 hypothetical protein [Myxococcaceae bacterium]